MFRQHLARCTHVLFNIFKICICNVFQVEQFKRSARVSDFERIMEQLFSIVYFLSLLLPHLWFFLWFFLTGCSLNGLKKDTSPVFYTNFSTSTLITATFVSFFQKIPNPLQISTWKSETYCEPNLRFYYYFWFV